MKIVVATLSVLNVAAGVAMALLYVIESDAPMFVLTISAALLVQGCFTLVLIVGAFSHIEMARHVQLAGSTLALVVGTFGFATGFVANIDPVNGHPEYGPMTIALLIATHGFVSLLAFTPQPRVNVQTPPG